MREIYLICILVFSSGCIYLPRSNTPEVLHPARLHGELQVGMPQEQVQAQWGAADRIVKKKRKDYDEIWIYIPHWKERIYLYFKNGILQKIE